jgi:uncharacterized protein
MKIHLDEIPADGRRFKFDRKTGELNQALKELLGETEPYSVDLKVERIGNVHQVTGTIEASTQELCSKCGWEIPWPIRRKVNEYLIELDPDEHRKSHSVHGSLSVDFLAEGAPSVTNYQDGTLDLGLFAHQQILEGQELYPDCRKSDCERMIETQSRIRALEEEAARAGFEPKAGLGLQALGSLKRS